MTEAEYLAFYGKCTCGHSVILHKYRKNNLSGCCAVFGCICQVRYNWRIAERIK